MHSRWLPQSRCAGDLHAVVYCPVVSGTQRLDLAERAWAHLGLARGRPLGGDRPSAGTWHGGVCRAGAPTGVGTWPGHSVLPCETVNLGKGGIFHSGFRLDARGDTEEPCWVRLPVPRLSGHQRTGAGTFQTRVLCDPVVLVLDS